MIRSAHHAESYRTPPSPPLSSTKAPFYGAFAFLAFACSHTCSHTLASRGRYLPCKPGLSGVFCWLSRLLPNVPSVRALAMQGCVGLAFASPLDAAAAVGGCCMLTRRLRQQASRPDGPEFPKKTPAFLSQINLVDLARCRWARSGERSRSRLASTILCLLTATVCA